MPISSSLYLHMHFKCISSIFRGLPFFLSPSILTITIRFGILALLLFQHVHAHLFAPCIPSAIIILRCLSLITLSLESSETPVLIYRTHGA